MGADTKIEWADDTVNAWWGCTKISPGCAHCYADEMGTRFGVQWGDSAERRLRVEAAVRELVRIANRGDREGRPRRVFMQSMSDLFEDRDDLRGPRARIFGALNAINQDRVRLIPMLLTKRAEHLVAEVTRLGLPPGAWVGVSVENQAAADERIPHLLRIPGAVRFLSMEPLLGAVDLTKLWCHNCETDDHVRFDPPAQPGCVECDSEVGPAGWLDPCADERQGGISWVIVGGESGPKARPMHPAWARSLRDQCVEAGVAFFFKQWGEWAPEDRPEELAQAVALDLLTDGMVRRLGKHAAGRLLDGREWNEVPDAA